MDCTFDLNGKPMSTLKCGPLTASTFSGPGSHTNRREFACSAGVSPLPPGSYYIIDRQSGGVLSTFRDMFNDRKEWFALYAIDGKIDDETYCNKVKRGAFQLHTKGPLGTSEGCITVGNRADFDRLRAVLKSSPQVKIAGTDLKSYGKVPVK